MNFPQTRLTLIQRITKDGHEEDWRQFLEDYWNPVCRFAARRAALSHQDAEDVASKTFEGILKNRLLERWADQPTAKLRTLLCRVVQNVLSNRARVAAGRQRLLRELAEHGTREGSIHVGEEGEVSAEDDDVFYAAWVWQLVYHTVEALMVDLHGEGKGDYFRVLYSRTCEEMTTRQVSESLGIKVTDAENYFKAVKKRLAAELEGQVRTHVERYAAEELAEAEFLNEWSAMGDYLHRAGGIELIVRQVYQDPDRADQQTGESDSFITTQRLL